MYKNVCYQQAMILVEVGQHSDWFELYKKDQNDEWQREELDMLPEVKEQAQLRNKKHKALIVWAANWKIIAKSFPKGSLIIQRVEGPQRILKEGKLASSWEGF